MSGTRVLRSVGLALLVLLTAACGRQKSSVEQASDALSRGLRAHNAGRLQEAEADYHQVLVYDPQNKFAYYNLGLVDQTSGRSAAAELEYRLALLRRTDGDQQEAVDLYRHVIEIQPNNAAAHLNLGDLLVSTGQQAEGAAERRIALQLNPQLATSPTGTPTAAPAPPTPTSPGP